MPQLKATILIQGRPAKKLYVEHIWKFGGITGTIGLYITDDRGRIMDENGALGVRSTTSGADIRILGQNSVAKIVRGGPLLSVWDINFERRIEDGGSVNIDVPEEHVEHFRILEMAMQSYDDVHRHFEPFSSKPTGFPLGRKATFEATRGQKKRIEIVYPDNLPQPTPFVEPKSIATTYPLIHLKDKNQAAAIGRPSNYSRLMGINGYGPDIIPAELSHALHFSHLDTGVRKSISDKYIRFLISDMMRDGDGSHSANKRTTPMVAFIEAMDHFSTRASSFVATHRTPQNPHPTFDAAMQLAFIKAETDDPAPGQTYWYHGHVQIARNDNGTIRPRELTFTALESEAAVYAAIFLDFAHRTTLATAVKFYHQTTGALTFTEYHQTVQAENNHEYTAAIDQVRQSWDLSEHA